MSCKVCGGRGYLIKSRTINMLTYDYIYHCECKAGLCWTYDGRIIQKDQSYFRIPSIRDYHDGTVNQISP